MSIAAAEGHFLSADGLKLFYRWWTVPQPRGVCLLVHGIAEHSGRYEHLAQALTAQGLSVWALDHRGHGRSEGLRGDCRSLEEFVGDLRRLAQQARIGRSALEEAPPRAAAQTQRLPLLLVGHSLGGLIALSFCARYPEEVRAVAVSSPALKLTHETPAWKVSLVTATSRVFPTFPFQNGVNPKVLCRDPRVVEAYLKDPLVHHVLTARCAVALRDAMRESLDLARRLKVPCLFLQAGADEICDPKTAAEFSRRADGNGITFRRYDGFYHELFNEPEQARVIGDLCQWLDGILKG